MGKSARKKTPRGNKENEYQANVAESRESPSPNCSAHQTRAKKQYVEKSVKDFRERHRNTESDPPQPIGKSEANDLLFEAHNVGLPERPSTLYPQGGFEGWFWILSGALILLAVILVIQNPHLTSSFNASLEAGFSNFKARRNQVDYRVLALDFLRTWTLENNLPSKWSNELEDALIHVEESESRDPEVGTGVLLSCKVEKNCKSIMDKLQEHLLEHDAANGKKCVLRLNHSTMDGEDLGGQVQHKIVQVLKPCQKAVVIVDDAHRMPYKAAKVFTNALAEMGGFVDWGNHVPSTNALYLMSMVAESDANMSLEKFIKVVKDHLVNSLSKVDRLVNKGDAQTNMPAINAGALRRRLSWAIPVDPVK